MAAGNEVKLVFAGDASSLQRTFTQVGSGATSMAGQLDSASGKAKTFGSRMDDVGGAVGGAESKFMGTADLLDGLGGAFGLPTENATGLMRAFGDLSGGFEVVSGLFPGLISKLGAMIGVTAGQAAATEGATVAQAGLNTAMMANPIGLVIAAIVALIAVGVLLWKNWDTIKDVAETAFGFVLDVVQGVWNWVKDNWPLLLAILTGPIGVAVYMITQHWDTIKEAFTKVKDWIGDRIGDIVGFITGIPSRIAGVASTMWDGLKTAFTGVKDWVSDRLGDIVGFFTGMPERIATAAKGMFDGLIDAFKGAANWIIDHWNDLHLTIGGQKFDLPGPFGSITIPSINLDTPDIRRFHSGGVVPGGPNSETLAILQGGERVIPNGGGMGGPVFNINLPPTGDPDSNARAIVEQVEAYFRRSGRAWAAA